jgi:tetratricopeptide (TPR) repeat protein
MLATPRFLLETPRITTEGVGWDAMPHDKLLANLEALLAKGGDGAVLRLALAARYLDAGDTASAVRHAEAAVRIDPEYSAAWKALGRALTAAGRGSEALTVYDRGAAVAERRGDRQAAKEMRVFAKRLRRSASGTDKNSEA